MRNSPSLLDQFGNVPRIKTNVPIGKYNVWDQSLLRKSCCTTGAVPEQFVNFNWLEQIHHTYTIGD